MSHYRKRRLRLRLITAVGDTTNSRAVLAQALAWFEARKQWHGPHYILGMIKALKCYSPSP